MQEERIVEKILITLNVMVKYGVKYRGYCGFAVHTRVMSTQRTPRFVVKYEICFKRKTIKISHRKFFNCIIIRKINSWSYFLTGCLFIAEIVWSEKCLSFCCDILSNILQSTIQIIKIRKLLHLLHKIFI